MACRFSPSAALVLIVISTTGHASRVKVSLNISKSTFLVKTHQDCTRNACSAPIFLAPGSDAANALPSVLGQEWRNEVCDELARGVIWPDCPTTPEQMSIGNSCMLGVPFHDGMQQMLWQAVVGKFGAVPEWGPNKAFQAYTVNVLRQSVQHQHASPLLPLHLDDGRHVAVITNGQLRSKVVQQAMQWQCKSMVAFDQADSLPGSRELSDKTRVGLLFFGKIIHMVQDSFSLSHCQRSDAQIQNGKIAAMAGLPTAEQLELLKGSPIKKFYSMDDVDWNKHASKDKPDTPDGKAFLDLANVATSRVLTVLDDMLQHINLARKTETTAPKGGPGGPGGPWKKQALRQFEGPGLHALGRILCEEVFRIDNSSAGAGGSSKDIGRNGDASDWIPEVAADDDTRKLVSDHLKTLLSDIQDMNSKGKLPLDKDIPFQYPSLEDDICAKLAPQLSCSENFSVSSAPFEVKHVGPSIFWMFCFFGGIVAFAFFAVLLVFCCCTCIRKRYSW